MDRLWDLLASSTLVQAIVSLLFSFTVCYMFVKGMEVPPLLAATLGTVLGFWFGTKSQQLINRRAS